MAARRRFHLWVAAVAFSAYLVTTPSSVVAQTTQPDPVGAGCPAGVALLEAGQPAAAAETYIAVLRRDSGSRCALDGLAAVAKATATPSVDTCAIASAFRSADAEDQAKAVLEEAIKKGQTECTGGKTTLAGELKALNTKSWPDRVTAVWTEVGKVLPAVLVGLLLLTVLVSWVRPLRRRIFRPQLVFETFGDPSTDPKAAATMTALALVSQRQPRLDAGGDALPRIDIVDAFSDLPSAVPDFGKISSQLEPVGAMLKSLDFIIRRPLLKVSGQVHAAGKRGPGLTLRLVNRSRLVALDTLWGVPGNKANEDDFAALSVPAGAWVSCAVAAELRGNSDLPNALSYAWLVAGTDAAMSTDRGRAIACYERALEADPANLRAMAGWVLARAAAEKDPQRRLNILEDGFTWFDAKLNGFLG